jgi:hypothetical protein
VLDYIEIEGNWAANCQFPLALSENQDEPLGGKRRVTRFCPRKGPVVLICGLEGREVVCVVDRELKRVCKT